MEGLSGTGLADPIFGLVMVAGIAATLTVLALKSSTRSRVATDPLSGLFQPERFEAEIEGMQRRRAPLAPHGAILRGEIDHLSQIRALWGPETHSNVTAKVAQVIRAGVRKGDDVTRCEVSQGEGSFVIHTPGATEAEASAIAKRLLKTIGGTEIGAMGGDLRLSASFGVAARRIGETEAAWHARAGDALNAAIEAGEEQVVTASEWEEVELLPAPASPGEDVTPTDQSNQGASKAA